MLLILSKLFLILFVACFFYFLHIYLQTQYWAPNDWPFGSSIWSVFIPSLIAPTLLYLAFGAFAGLLYLFAILWTWVIP